jgi:CRP-like cAMP-binding protein
MKRDSFIADRELIQSLEERSKPIPCSEGRILFKQGDAPAGVYILQSGAAVLMMESASGKAVMFLAVEAQEVVPIQAGARSG